MTQAPLPVQTPDLPRRPTGVVLFGILQIIGGGLILILLFIPVQRPEELEEFGISVTLLKGAALFLGALTLAAGLGMFQRKPWGWRAGLASCIYGALRCANALLVAQELQENSDVAGEVSESVYWRLGIRGVLYLLIVVYLTRPHVKEYFQATQISSWKAILQTTGILVILGAALSFVLRWVG
jgi:hypothetical protein